MQGGTKIFRTVIHPSGQRQAAPFDDPLKRTNDPQGRDGGVRFNAQTLSFEVVQNVPGSGTAPVAELALIAIAAFADLGGPLGV